MTQIEQQARSLSDEAQRALLNTQNAFGAPVPPQGTVALYTKIQDELFAARAVTPSGSITYRGLALRDEVLQQKLDALDPPAATVPFVPEHVRNTNELIAAAREWYRVYWGSVRTAEMDAATDRLARAVEALGNG